VDGLGQADVVQRMNAASPLTLAANKGLYEALGLAAPRCGETTMSWQFVATEPAKAAQCRLRGTNEAVQGEDVSVSGELQVEFVQGHRERFVGRSTISAQRSGMGLPTTPVVSTAEPPLSFVSEHQGRVGLQLQQEDWRLEALAHLYASPMVTALFRPKTPTIDSFEQTFGVSPKDWLERMTVISESCVIDKATAAPGAVGSGQQSAMAEPVVVHAEVLGGKLLELSEPPCSLDGARVKLVLTGFPELAPTTVSGSAFIVADRRHMIWPTDPPPTQPGPAVLVRIGDTAPTRVDVPAPKWLVDRVPCAAQQNASFELQIAAALGEAGLETSIAMDWHTPCASAVGRCRFRATK
jgi:hypothetical protein